MCRASLVREFESSRLDATRSRLRILSCCCSPPRVRLPRTLLLPARALLLSLRAAVSTNTSLFALARLRVHLCPEPVLCTMRARASRNYAGTLAGVDVARQRFSSFPASRANVPPRIREFPASDGLAEEHRRKCRARYVYRLVNARSLKIIVVRAAIVARESGKRRAERVPERQRNIGRENVNRGTGSGLVSQDKMFSRLSNILFCF